MEKLVSIIVPIYNVEKYVCKCIDSILAQTYQNIEVLLINDGSTDNSLTEIEKYRSNLKCKIIDKKNGGSSSARNAGLDLAIGDYIYFIDSDDYIAPNAIELLLKKMLETDADFCCYRVAFFKEGSNKYKVHGSNFKYNTIDNKEELLKKALLTQEIKATAWSKFFTRQFIQNNKLRFEYGILNEDILFTTQCGIYAKKVAFINEVLYFALMRPTSISRDIKAKNLTDYFIIFDKIKKLLKENNLFNDFEKYYFASYVKNILFTLVLSAYRFDSYSNFKIFYSNLIGKAYCTDIKNCSSIGVISSKIKILYKISLRPKLFYFFIKSLKFGGLKIY